MVNNDIKVGDYVMALDSIANEFTKYKIYRVKKNKYNAPNVIFIEKDDKGSTENGWSKSRFLKIEEKHVEMCKLLYEK